MYDYAAELDEMIAAQKIDDAAENALDEFRDMAEDLGLDPNDGFVIMDLIAGR